MFHVEQLTVLYVHGWGVWAKRLRIWRGKNKVDFRVVVKVGDWGSLHGSMFTVWSLQAFFPGG